MPINNNFINLSNIHKHPCILGKANVMEWASVHRSVTFGILCISQTIKYHNSGCE